jgi:hypothetical protein
MGPLDNDPQPAQRTIHPKQLDSQAPTRAIGHDTFHNDAHSIRTKELERVPYLSSCHRNPFFMAKPLKDRFQWRPVNSIPRASRGRPPRYLSGFWYAPVSSQYVLLITTLQRAQRSSPLARLLALEASRPNHRRSFIEVPANGIRRALVPSSPLSRLLGGQNFHETL